MKIEVSNGELFDKHTILCIKQMKITDEEKLKYIRDELNVVKACVDSIFESHTQSADILQRLFTNLLSINLELWNIEDEIRDRGSKKKFDDEFVVLAVSVYTKNDLRAQIKRQIDIETNSELREQKSYKEF